MFIEENKVFIFKFPYENTELTIPVRADSRTEAIEKLQKWMSKVQTDLAMESPQVQDGNVAKNALESGLKTPYLPIPDEVIELRISTLMSKLGASQESLSNDAYANTIKNFTKLDFVPKNYTKVVTKLEELVSKNDQ